jgi:ribosomal protein S18 acetylase RimI-like enzyme
MAEEIRARPDPFLVAEVDDGIIGCIGGADGRRGIVYQLAVERGHRRKGIGRALMDELEARLQSKGCLKYYLLVTMDNRAAIDFYQNMGCELMDLYVIGKVIQ